MDDGTAEIGTKLREAIDRLRDEAEWLRTQANDIAEAWAVGDCIGGLQLAHLGAYVPGRQLVSNRRQPAKDESIADLVRTLQHLSLPQP